MSKRLYELPEDEYPILPVVVQDILRQIGVQCETLVTCGNCGCVTEIGRRCDNCGRIVGHL